MFIYETMVRLHDTDAAGRLYFANQFRLVHEAYEAFLHSLGYDLSEVLARGRIALPIAHASADFHRPLQLGDALRIELGVERVGRTSFTLRARLSAGGHVVGHATTVHVAVRLPRGAKTTLPARLGAALKRASSAE
jgi:1,4-dihydroxy-2-naphthoyl-CoA hydrolase